MRILIRALSVARIEGFLGVWRRLKMRSKPMSLRVSKALGSAYVTSVYGLKFASNYRDATFRFYVIGAYGFFYWDRLLNKGHPFLFLDIGANQGLYAIGSTKNPNLVLSYAFEPVEETFEYLSKNIKINEAKSRVLAIRKAISDRRGVAKIATKVGHSGVATLAGRNGLLNKSPDVSEIEIIDAADLDAIVQDNDLPISVKIDVEGYEPVVIDQLLKTKFARRIEEIYFEVDERWVDVRVIEGDLREAGFVVFTKVGGGSHYDLLASRTPQSH